MNIEQWWPRLAMPTRSWLIAHNGEPIPRDIASEITDAGGEVGPDPDGDAESTDLLLTDEHVDWIEEIANDEGMG